VVHALRLFVCALLAALAASLTPAAAGHAALGEPHHVSWVAGSPTASSLAASLDVVAAGRPVTLTGRLTDPATGSGIAEAPVRLEALDAPSQTWLPVEDAATDAGGAVSVAVRPAAATTYRLHHGDPGTPEESVSAPVSVRTVALSRAAVPVGRPVTVTGVLGAGVSVLLERRVGGRWVLVSRTRTAADGSFRFTVTLSTVGWWHARVRRPAAGVVVRLPRVDVFRPHTYSVVSRGPVRVPVRGFRALVASTYADPRGWRAAHHRFREVSRGGSFTVVLSQARWLPAFSGGCSSSYSCRVGRLVIINARRWAHGSPHFSGDLATYRSMLVNHETGHWLGLGHASCPRRGARAPVMQQQSKGLHGCRPNAWPLPRELAQVS
jgi:hypothetical protein